MNFNDPWTILAINLITIFAFVVVMFAVAGLRQYKRTLPLTDDEARKWAKANDLRFEGVRLGMRYFRHLGTNTQIIISVRSYRPAYEAVITNLQTKPQFVEQ